ncbi:EAL and HDOD domain-containing protein [Anaerotignum sp. MB30-C6]|uniref:EAL and HDOD domain-containing protein n=1 Tax=Anaerotignum sp. MB30-C6 TaxID=3070814 RepID=UPI0027DB7070|nr:HDOD domain-containing protein [Anaerotignum sp. MB30-C6]WMI81997.1 HDOD domain-containing protein [Anaerotignum sp. MB30-C6]
MKLYIARQPIFNKDMSLFGYELLYRNSAENCFPGVDDAFATKELTSNVLTEFDFTLLTNGKYGFINFSKDVLMSAIPLLFNPQNTVIEILEDVTLDEALVEKIKLLKKKKYIIALDDFVNDGRYEEIMPFIEMIKVEYTLLSPKERKKISQRFKGRKKLVAERIETQEDFKMALEDGYELFQGYFFSKPVIVTKTSITIAQSSYFRLWKEASRETPDFNALTEIIRLDVGLMHKLLAHLNTLVFYRGNRITSIKSALVYLGIKRTKRWIMLLLLREITGNENNELAKQSLIRAVFMEKLMEELGREEEVQDAYLVGLFSKIDNVLEDNINSILNELGLPKKAIKALVNKEGILGESLECIKNYENSNWGNVAEYALLHGIKPDFIPSLYLYALEYGDKVFESNSEK